MKQKQAKKGVEEEEEEVFIEENESDNYDEEDSEQMDDSEEEEDQDQEDESEADDNDEEQEDEDQESEENGRIHTNRNEDVVDDLFYDPFNLTVANYHALPFQDSVNASTASKESFEQLLVEQSTRAAQLLYQKLSTLPTESSDAGPVTILPSEISILPRTHKIPEPKPETKWEKFAREKGIKKRKRDRMIYDEETGEYKPRFGYKRIKNGLEDIPIVEVKEGQDPYQDPWQVDRQAKKDRVKQNQKNQIKNQLHREKIAKKGSKQFDAAVVPGIPVEFNQMKRGKQGLKQTLKLVQNSTASLGRYDEMRPGEPSRKLITKTKKHRDNVTNMHQDKQLMKETLRFVSNKKEKKEKGITNSLAAYEGILPDAPELRFKQKKGKGKGKSR